MIEQVGEQVTEDLADLPRCCRPRHGTALIMRATAPRVRAYMTMPRGG
ncbi:hypothetical protein [Rhodopila sp.]